MHRFQTQFKTYRLPRPADPAIVPGSYYLFPLAWLPGGWEARQAIYQEAFEQARAMARPSLPERDLLAVWN